MEEDTFTVVPIVLGFDHGKVVGELRIKTESLPPTPEFVFSIGYKIKDMTSPAEVLVPTIPYKGKYRLVSVSPVDDDGYIEYLRQIGKLPKDLPIVDLAEGLDAEHFG